jgi:hypothetical protein
MFTKVLNIFNIKQLQLYHLYTKYISMEHLVKKVISIFTILVIFLPLGNVFAVGEDFSIANNTQVIYSTGDSFVTVKTEYLREVNNRTYYYPAQGEKIFHIPDLPLSKDYELELERQFKKDSLSVKDENGRSVSYTLEDLELGEGIYVKVANYKQTVYGNDYKIFLEYKTHDLVTKVFDFITIQAPSLPKDIVFQQTDESTGTKTSFSYGLSIVTDENIPKLAKSFPSGYSVETKNGKTYYNFNSDLRTEKSPYLEFGLEQVYRFELRYTTPKTDNFIPEQYSSLFKALSTNIYELSLPRDFAEVNQRVKIADISPTPKKISKDLEGNIIATFEVDANKVSEIVVNGYVWVEQNSLDEPLTIPNPDFESYKRDISNTTYSKSYIGSTKYWEVNDSYIQSEAKGIIGDNKFLLDIIKADYAYVNKKLEYDQSKASSTNERIGAKAALQGGGSVCMEYADVMVALLRAQGIPARAALGYANLTTLEDSSEGSNIRHQWVQVWVPDYGWLSIDPTYESLNMSIGQDIQRVLWESFNGDDLSNIRVYSADRLEDLDSLDYLIKIYAVSKDSIPESLYDYSEIVPVQEGIDSKELSINTFVKTTSLGKSLVIVAPILMLIFALILLLAFVRVLFKRIKVRKVSRD